MMLFDPSGTIKKYDGPEEIVKEFFDVRLDLYKKRKAHLLKVAEAELLRISNKARFILAVVDGSLVLANRKKEIEIVADLEGSGYSKLAASDKKKSPGADAGASDADGETPAGSNAASYDYLLNMSLSSLTLEKVEALKKQESECHAEVEVLKGTTEAQMWRDDLEAFLDAYSVYEEEDQDKARRAEAASKNAKKAKGKGKKGGKKKNKES